MTNQMLMQQYYIAYYGRPADPEGLDFWVQAIELGALSFEDAIAAFGASAEFDLIYGDDPTAEEFFIAAYQNILNRAPDAGGLAFWLGVYDSYIAAGMTADEARAKLVIDMVEGISGGSAVDQVLWDNKLKLAEQTTELARELSDESASALINFVRDEVLQNPELFKPSVFAQESSAITSQFLILKGIDDGGQVLTLTVDADTLVGWDGVDTTFSAPLESNILGLSSNTFQPTDSLDGGLDSTNILVATVISQGTNIFGTVAIDANTTNVQNMFFTATGGDEVLIDAYRNASWNMDDVEQWWSVQSDTDLIVTDATLNTFVGMDGTGTGVNYTVNFRPQSLDGDDVVNIVLNDVGNGEQGGTLSIGSTTPSNADVGKTGIENFNVFMGASSSFLTALETTNDRLTNVTVAESPDGDLGAPGAPIGVATADTLLEIDEHFRNLTSFDAAGFVGQIGSDANRMGFDYTDSLPAGSTFGDGGNTTATILGGDGGNVMGVFIGTNQTLGAGANEAMNLNLTGGVSSDDFYVGLLGATPGLFNNIAIDTGPGGDNEVELFRLSGTGNLDITAAGGDDSIAVTRVNVGGSATIAAGDGDNVIDYQGLSNAARATVGGNLIITAGDGFDEVTVRNVNLTGVGSSGMGIDVSDGGSDITVQNMTIASFTGAAGYSLSIVAGADGDLGNTVFVDNVITQRGGMNIVLGDGLSDVTVQNSSVGSVNARNLNIAIGDGNADGDLNSIDVLSTTVSNNAFITSAGGRDDIFIDNSSIGRALQVDAGEGDNTVVLQGSTLNAAGLLGVNTIDTGTGNDLVIMNNVTSRYDDVEVRTGGGTDTVSFSGGNYTSLGIDPNTVSVNTGAGVAGVFFNGGLYNNIVIQTYENPNPEEDNDVVVFTGVTYDGSVTIATGGGDDYIAFFDTLSFGLDLDGGSGYDTFRINQSFADGMDDPLRFTDIERLELQGQGGTQTVDMEILNSKADSDDAVVETVVVRPTATGGLTEILNLDPGLGQDVVITNLGLPAGVSNVGDVYLSTKIDDEADIRTVDVTIDASQFWGVGVTSVTRVDTLIHEDLSIGAASIEVFRLTSTGDQSLARNAISNLVIADVELLRIQGDRDLGVHIGDSDSNGVIDLFSNEDIVDIRANTLDANLTLALFANNLSTSGTSNDQLIANGEYDNLLALYGDMEITVGDGVGETLIEGFDTIQFGFNSGGNLASNLLGGVGARYAEGSFDATNLNGVDYIVGPSPFFAPPQLLALTGLEDGVNVTVGEAGAPNNWIDVPLTLGGRGAGTTLNLDVLSEVINMSWLVYTPGVVRELTINEFETINLDLGRSVSFASGVDPKAIYLVLDDVARELIITGADPDEPDSLDLLVALPATLTVIDVTGYAGTFTAFMTDLDGTDVDVFLGAEDVNFSLADFQLASETTFTVNAEFSGATSQFNLVTNFGTFSLEFGLLTDGLTKANAIKAYLEGLNLPQGAFAVDVTDLGGLAADADVTFTPAGLTPLVVDLAATNAGSSASLQTSNLVTGDPGEASDYNTIFHFTDSADDSVWTIDNFIAVGAEGSSGNNYTVLKIGELADDFTQLALDFDGTDTTITLESDPGWQIVLTGVQLDPSDLASANFDYA
jgi:hypothetical protein